jgi:hypothetical protein
LASTTHQICNHHSYWQQQRFPHTISNLQHINGDVQRYANAADTPAALKVIANMPAIPQQLRSSCYHNCCSTRQLNTSTQTQHQMKGGLLLDVVISQGAAILQLLACKDQALLVWGDTCTKT